MNMKILHFAALLAISAAFLACTYEEHRGCAMKAAAKPGYIGLDELDPICKSEQKKYVRLYDTNTVKPPENLDSLIYERCDKKLEGKECKDEIMKYEETWSNEHKKRDLPIPCLAFDKGVNYWEAWLTDEEIIELVETYGVLYSEPVVDGKVPEDIKELDSYKNLDQSCKTEQKKLVSFYDYSTPEINWDYVYSHLSNYVPGTGIVPEFGGGSYNINGIEMNQEEYDAYRAEYWRKYYEESEKNKRNLPIPCVIYSNGDNGVALLTDREKAIFEGEYDNLSIEYYRKAIGGGGWVTDYDETTTIPPPSSGKDDIPDC